LVNLYRYSTGQQLEVAVYQLVTAGTVEERIVGMAKGKLAIERLVVAEAGNGGGGKAGQKKSGEGGGDDDDDDVDDDGKRGGSGNKNKAGGSGKTDTSTKDRAAELAEVLMHGARGVMVRTAVTSDADNKDRMTTAAAEPTDAEIERLLDRANLPEEVDGEDGAAYLGNVGNATIAIGGEGDEENGEGEGDAAGKDDGEGDADMQLELLLSERAARLGAFEEEELGRGKRERRQVLANLGGAVHVECT
jgi:chromodomain-helicase-DNA-binding protein 4